MSDIQMTEERSLLLGLTRQEWRGLLGLTGIFSLRMLGLFLVLPVLSPYALGLEGATPFLAGMAVGAYGLSQTALQVPLGLLSDRWGRKGVLALGLALFALGSAWAAWSTDIMGLILGRLLQGSGAIASVVIAMVADVTREEVRTRAMAVVGVSIGLSFAAGFLFGPVLAARWGVPLLFWLMAAMSVVAILYLPLFLPSPRPSHRGEISLRQFRRILADRNLVCLDILMFLLHLGMTGVFVVTPVLLAHVFVARDLWKVYVPMILLGGGVMLPAMAYAERKKRLRELLVAGIGVAAIGYGMLGFSSGRPALLVAGLIVYFIGFNLLEPALPSLVTRFAPANLRATSAGFFSMSQCMGAFCGGAVGGLFLGGAPHWLYGCLLIGCLPWCLAAGRMDDPRLIREARFKAPPSRGSLGDLRRLRGVYDAFWEADGTLKVRYSEKWRTETGLRQWLEERGFF